MRDFGLLRSGGARPPVQATIAFIDTHRKVHGVEPICRVLPIAPSICLEHAASGRDPDRAWARQKRDAALARGSAGCSETISAPTACGGLATHARGRDPDRPLHGGPPDGTEGRHSRQSGDDHRQRQSRTLSLDRVNRQFRAPAPNVLWVSDFTCCTSGGRPGRAGSSIIPTGPPTGDCET